jgi:hypothetical protein
MPIAFPITSRVLATGVFLFLLVHLRQLRSSFLDFAALLCKPAQRVTSTVTPLHITDEYVIHINTAW